MNIFNYEKMGRYEFFEWMIKSVPDITPSQREKIRDLVFLQCLSFVPVKRAEKVGNFWLRLSAIFILPTMVILLCGIPFNFIITGRWGYSIKYVGWYGKWVRKCGLFK